MNPLPLVRAALARNPFSAAIFTLLIALALGLGIAISVQERALRQGSARAADRFDLIVAAPGSQIDVLFSAVYLRTTAVELLPGTVVDQVLNDPAARFAAPIAFGDSWHDSPVVGTTADFVAYLSDGLAEGVAFTSINQAVVGALVDLRIGQSIAIRHGHADDRIGGMDADSYEPAEDHSHDHDHDHDSEGHDHDHEGEHLHDDVTITGRMKPTGTPWDRAVIVPVEYVWQAHAMGTGHAPGDDRIGAPWQADLLPGLPAIVVKPESIAAAYGLRSRYRTSDSMAFFPAETLVELYEVTGGTARIMAGLTLAAQILVVAAILAGLLAVLDLQRQRFAVLRALGAPASYLFLTVWLYVTVMVLGGALLGLPLGWAASALISARISVFTGVAMQAQLGVAELWMAGALVLAGMALALVPAIRVYRQPVVDGLR